MSCRSALATSARLILLSFVIAALQCRSYSSPVATSGAFIDPNGPGQATALARAPSAPEIVYAAFTNVGIFRSNDGGRTFTPGPNVNPFTSCTVTCMDVHPTDPNTVLAGSFSPYNSYNRREAFLWRTTDGGASWKIVFWGGYYYDFEAITSVRFSPSSPDIALAGLMYESYIYAPSGPMIRSINGGATWEFVPLTQFPTAGSGGALSSIMFDTVQPGRVLAGFGDDDSRNNYGLFRSENNGQTWSRLNVYPFDGTTNQPGPIFDLVQSPAAPATIYAGTAIDSYSATPAAVFRSTDAGDTWTTASASLPYMQVPRIACRIIPDPTNPGTFRVTDSRAVYLTRSYGLGSGSPIFKTTDNGETWTPDVSGITINPFTGSMIQSVLVSAAPSLPRVLVASAYSGLWRLEEGQSSYQASGQNLPLSNVQTATALGGDPARIVAGPGAYLGANTGPVALGSLTSLGWQWVPSSTSLYPANTGASVVSDSASRVAGSFGGTIWRSLDSGVNWTATPTSATALALSPDNSELFLSAESGIFRSSDLGMNLSLLNAQFAGIPPRGMCFGTPGEMAVAVSTNRSLLGGGVYVSSDDGLSFAKRNHGMQPRVIAENMIWSTSPDFKLFAANSGAFVKSDNGGASWYGRTLHLPPSPGAQPQDLSIRHLAVANSSTSRTIWIASTGSSTYVYRSRDDGANWDLVRPNPSGYVAATKFGVTPNQDVIWICAYTNVLYRSEDKGETWTSSTLPMSQSATGFDVAPGGTVLAVASNENLYRSTDAGQTWIQLSLPSAMSDERITCLSFSPASSATLLAGTNYGLWYSTNSGATWSKWNISSTNSIPQIAFAPSDPTRVYCYDDDGNIFRSTNGGITWQQQAPDVGYVNYGQNGERQLAISPQDAQTLLFAAYYNTVFKSSNGGVSWSVASPDLENTSVNSVAMNSSNGLNMVCATSRDGLYRTTDGGLNWTNVMDSVWNYQANKIVANPTVPGEFVAATGWGLFVSRDSGGTWSPLCPELDQVPVTDVQLVPTTGRVDVIACTPTHGIWTTSPAGRTAAAMDWQLFE